MATPKRYCIPGICTAISAINTRAITAAKGKAYFIDHSFAFELNNNFSKSYDKKPDFTSGTPWKLSDGHTRSVPGT